MLIVGTVFGACAAYGIEVGPGTVGRNPLGSRLGARLAVYCVLVRKTWTSLGDGIGGPAQQIRHGVLQPLERLDLSP